MGRRKSQRLRVGGSSVLVISLDHKLKVLIFFQKFLGKNVRWVCDKANISRATFYRHKKKLDGKMVITKR